MPQIVKFTQDFGPGLKDIKSKSVVSSPFGACVDLDNCGVTTHIKHGYDATINGRENCAPPRTFLAFSQSGLLHAGARNPASTVNGSGVTIADDGGPIFVGMSLLNDILQRGGETPDVLRAAIASSTGIPIAQVKFMGRSFAGEGADKRTVFQVGYPVRSTIMDNCGEILLHKTSASVSAYGFDDETCRQILLWQMSRKVAWSPDDYTAGVNVGSVPQLALDNLGLLNDLDVAATLETSGVVPSDAQCGALTGLTRVPYISLLNAELSFGL